MEFDICKRAKEGVIVVAHRGTSGGNIPCNTIPAYEIALRHGADMLEIDVDRTKDGKLVIFHPGKEWEQLKPGNIRVPDMTYAEILEGVRYKNSVDLAPTEYSLNTLEEVLERFRGRCYINVDKFWENPEAIIALIRKYGMEEQIIVKTEPSRRMFDLMENYPEIQYLPMIRDDNVHEELMRRRLRYVGAEVLFESETSPFASDAFIEKMHRDGKLIWVNAIVYYYRTVLAAGHNDDRAMCGDPDGSWGWMVNRGYDIIQTDWVHDLCDYLKKIGNR